MKQSRFQHASSAKLLMTSSDSPARTGSDASRRFMPVNSTDHPGRPMSFAEAAECCGQYSRDAETEEVAAGTCANCPLLLDRRREEFLRQTRAH